MGRAEGMRDVEVDAPADVQPGAPEPGPDVARRRRRLLRWWPVALVLVAAVVGSQVLHDARARARVAAAREHPEVVGYDVDPALPVSAADPDSVWNEPGAVVAGVRVGSASTESGEPRAVEGGDVASGEVVWRTPVESAEEAAALGSLQPPWCTVGEPVGDAVTCFVQDVPMQEVDDDSWQMGVPVRSRLLTVDARTGEVTAERELAPVATAFVVDDVLLRAELVEDVLRVVAEDAATGDETWSVDLPVVTSVLEIGGVQSPNLQATERHVVAGLGGHAWSLRRSDGSVEVTSGQVWVGRDERLVSSSDRGRTSHLHGADGRFDVATAGEPVTFGLDDGSVPALDLLVDTSEDDRRIRAVDAATGETAWEYPVRGAAYGSVLLLDDVLYGADAEDVWAVDARDGREVWRSPRHPDGEPGPTQLGLWLQPLTDGRSLLLLEPVGSDGTQGVLRAWSLTSGEALWSTPLPPEAGGYVTVRDGVLYGGLPDPVRLGG